mgnify:CR=1 FL=1
MKKETHETVDVIVWALAIIVFVTGCGMQWGWPVALVALGGIFTFWPLFKR